MMISLFFLAGCSAITVKPSKIDNINRPPDYEDTSDFYLFGLIGAHHYNVKDICFGRKALLIKNEYTPEDLSIAIKTLFFYLPKTVKIWCEST